MRGPRHGILRLLVLAVLVALPVRAAEPVALVELFTSEGCSSCPAADRLLSEIDAAARHDGRRVLPLAFHVDYWNRLGWVDPFSDASWSERQSDYAGRFDSRYTPQMIVNGREAFVGSDRKRATHAIEQALAAPAAIEIEVQVERPAADRLHVAYTVHGASPHGRLHAALVERGLSTQVPRGENAGRLLRHDNVVRRLEAVDVPAGGRGGLDVALPADVRTQHASVVLFVQDPRSLAILGATRVDLEDLAATR